MNKLKGWKELPIGTAILEAGNTVLYHTGDWRDFRPVWDQEKCIHCLQCWIYCPEGAVGVKDGKRTEFDLNFCKGCGICAEECPAKEKAITMTEEPQLV